MKIPPPWFSRVRVGEWTIGVIRPTFASYPTGLYDAPAYRMLESVTSTIERFEK